MSANEGDAAGNLVEANEEVRVRTAEGHLIETVDLLLDPFGDRVVTTDHLVHEARHQVGGVEGAKGRLAGQLLHESFECVDAAVMDRHDDARDREEIYL